MKLSNLKQIREHWYNAFYTGDTECLKQIETDYFTVATELAIQSKRSQIEAIRRAKEQGLWFAQGGSKRDVEIEFRPFEEGCVLAGCGFSLNGDVQGPMIMFTESWEWDGQRWRIGHLSYSSVLE